MKSRKPAYTFEDIRELSTDDKNREFKAGELFSRSAESWTYVLTKDQAKRPALYTDTHCKLHFNIDNPKDIPRAYTALTEVFWKYRDLIQAHKVLDFAHLEEHNAAGIKEINKLRQFKKNSYMFDANDGKIYSCENTEKIKSINRFIHSANRYRHGAQIVSYILLRNGVKFSEQEERYKQMIVEAEECLRSLTPPLKPGPTPNSDFPVQNSEFTSARVDQDHRGKQVVTYDPFRKYEFIDNPVLQSLVAPEKLDKRNFILQEMKDAVPYRTPRKQDVCMDVFAEIANTINEKNLTYWQNEVKASNSAPELAKFVSTLALYADPNTQIDSAKRTLAILDTITTIKSILLETSDKTARMFKTAPNSPLYTLCVAIDELMRADVKGAEKLVFLREIIAKHSQHSPEYKHGIHKDR